MSSFVVQAFSVGATNPVFAFSDAASGSQFVVASPDDVSGEVLPSCYEIWQRVSFSSNKAAPGLRVRYLVNGMPADEDAEFPIVSSRITEMSDGCCYLCVYQHHDNEPTYLVSGSFRGNEWIYDPFLGEILRVSDVRIEDGYLKFVLSGSARTFMAGAVYDYSTGQLLHGEPITYVAPGTG